MDSRSSAVFISCPAAAQPWKMPEPGTQGDLSGQFRPVRPESLCGIKDLNRMVQE